VRRLHRARGRPAGPRLPDPDLGGERQQGDHHRGRRRRPGRPRAVPVSSLIGKQVVTIEAIGEDTTGKAVQMAWVELGVPQCGYCQAGQIMSATALLKQKPNPTDADIDSAMSGNLCRCGTYNRIRAAIRQAAGGKGAMP
jgi:isoquinoline 1-oxidoreductase alpha subunit